ncbi:MAG: rod shape-determining protein MreC [Clostridia bacterium]|nr:rod shape-determining protein MreC [Clostridia bacterium]
MRRRRKISQKILVLLAVLVMSVALAFFTSLERPLITKLEAFWQDLLTPLENGVTTVVQSGKNIADRVLNYHHIQTENEELKRQVEELQEKLHLMEEYRLENIRLRNMVHFESLLADQYQMLGAKVVARHPSNWRQTLTINRGRRDGLREGMAVITPRGVVGRIGTLGERSAEVVLILDHEGALGGMIQSTRFPGIVESTGDRHIPLQMVQLPHDSPVKENQTVVTSGLGGIFPKGLRIGYVVAVQPEPNGLMKKALIMPFVDFERIEEVLVIMTEKGGE